MTALTFALLALNVVSAQQNEFYLRFLHAVPGAPPVDVYNDDSKIISNLPYTEISNYVRGVPDVYNFYVKLTGTNTTILALPGTSVGARGTTLVVGGNSSKIASFVVAEQIPAPVRYNYCLTRFAHFAPDVSLVSLWVDDHVDFPQVAFGTWAPTTHVTVPPGEANVSLSLYHSLPLTFALNATIACPVNQVQTVYAVGLASGSGTTALQFITHTD
jgi:hypothetical protein